PIHFGPRGPLRCALDRSRIGDGGSVKDNAAIRNRVPAPRDEEVGLDAPHVGGQDLPRNEDSAPRACAGKASLLERSPLPLRGMLLSDLSEIDDQRLPHSFPPYCLYRLNIVNYRLRNYAPLDRRLRAVAKLQSGVPAFLRDFRQMMNRRLADTFYEIGEMAASGMLDAYARELPDHLRDASPRVRAVVERTNAVATSELKGLVESLTTAYKPRIKREFALGPRKYARMIFAEHLAAIPLDRLTA